MRANAKNFTITSYAEYHQLDPSTIKIKEPNHLFDADLTNRKSNRRPLPPETSEPVKSAGPTIEQLIEQKEKASGVKKRKLFDYDDEW